MVSLFLPNNMRDPVKQPAVGEVSIDASRRDFLKRSAIAGVGAAALNVVPPASMLASEPVVIDGVPIERVNDLKLNINGKEYVLSVDTRTSLLDALREHLDMTGSKKGCDHGQCGACTVIIDGRRTLSCLTLAAMCDGKKVTTIEGIATGETLHPMQAAFIEYDGMQCGYCTPGQICSAIAMLEEAKKGDASHVTANVSSIARDQKLTKEEIRERMSGNICRCGAYPNIVDAIENVHAGKGGKR
jgi:xanthine dehydrogenase YagT iron-sulfur-binding subunit